MRGTPTAPTVNDDCPRKRHRTKCSQLNSLSRSTGVVVSTRGVTRPTGPSAKSTHASALLTWSARSEEHTSELQSLRHLVCRLLLEKKKKKQREIYVTFPRFLTISTIRYTHIS